MRMVSMKDILTNKLRFLTIYANKTCRIPVSVDEEKILSMKGMTE